MAGIYVKATEDFSVTLTYIARRNDLGKLVKGKNLTWHSMYAATACPGPYLSGKLQELVDKANTINGF